MQKEEDKVHRIDLHSSVVVLLKPKYFDIFFSLC